MPREPSVILSHWNHLYEGLEATPTDFYDRVVEALKKRNLKDATATRVKWPEGGIFSSKRLYLRVQRKDLVYDICAAPYGNGFFFSSWLGSFHNGFLQMLADIILIGIVIRLLFWNLLKPPTYYQVDTASMFQKSVHAAVMEVIDEIVEEKGLRKLTDDERKPVMKEFFGE